MVRLYCLLFVEEDGYRVVGTLGLDRLNPGAFDELDDQAGNVLLEGISGFVRHCREWLKRC